MVRHRISFVFLVLRGLLHELGFWVFSRQLSSRRSYFFRHSFMWECSCPSLMISCVTKRRSSQARFEFFQLITMAYLIRLTTYSPSKHASVLKQKKHGFWKNHLENIQSVLLDDFSWNRVVNTNLPKDVNLN